jgi:hypothetical protein
MNRQADLSVAHRSYQEAGKVSDPFKYARIHDLPEKRLRLSQLDIFTLRVRPMEVHFGRAVVARVRKCRLVVVKNKRIHEDPIVNERAR